MDATRQAARQRALPCDPALPPAKRRLDAVCAPGYRGRKRGEVVRTRTTALQMHTRQWIGTYSGKGNGDYRGELASALQAITTYLTHFAFTPEMALVRLDGQYGDAAVIAQVMQAGVYLVTRGRGYQLLERPQIQRVLAHPPTASVTRMNTGEVVALFDGGWLELGEGLPQIRVIVARHPAPPPGKRVKVGKRVDEWVYELFITTLDAGGFLVEDVLDLYHGRGAFEAVLADEDVEEDPDRWCSYTECGQELWQIACQWVWNLRLSLGHAMQAGEIRDIEWAPPKERPSLLAASEDAPEVYGPWQWARDGGRARGRFEASAFTRAARMEPCAVQRGRASGEAHCVKRIPLPNAPSTPAFRAIVGNVCCVSNVLGKERRETVLVGSVPFAAWCPRLRRSRLRPESGPRCGRWMWQAELFVAPGSPTGASNMSR